MKLFYTEIVYECRVCDSPTICRIGVRTKIEKGEDTSGFDKGYLEDNHFLYYTEKLRCPLTGASVYQKKTKEDLWKGVIAPDFKMITVKKYTFDR